MTEEHFSRDRAVRGMTDDGAFRVITLSTTNMVRDALAAQHARGVTAQRLGDLLTGAVMVRETMAPTLRVQTMLKDTAGGGSLVADAHPGGDTRGLIQAPKGKTDVALGDNTVLHVMRSLPRGMHQGVVEVPTTGTIAEALMQYMQQSEQVASMIAVSTVMDGDHVLCAGGYIVQLLPEVGTAPLAVMAERLVDFQSIDGLLASDRPTPEQLMAEILYGMPYTLLETTGVRFACQCSQVRVVLALSTLPRSDIEDLVADGEMLEIDCDYCGKAYRVAPAQLQGLLEQS